MKLSLTSELGSGSLMMSLSNTVGFMLSHLLLSSMAVLWGACSKSESSSFKPAGKILFFIGLGLAGVFWLKAPLTFEEKISETSRGSIVGTLTAIVLYASGFTQVNSPASRLSTDKEPPASKDSSRS